MKKSKNLNKNSGGKVSMKLKSALLLLLVAIFSISGIMTVNAATIKDDGKYTLLLSCVPSSDGKIDGDYTKMIKFDVADGDTTVSLSELTAGVLPLNGKTQFAYWVTDWMGETETRVPEDIPLSEFNSKGTFYVEEDEVEYTNGLCIYAAFSEEPLKGTGTYYLTLDGVGGKVNGKYEMTLTSSSNDFRTVDLTQYVPVREGYTFVGWDLNGEFVTEISADCFKESDAVKVLATYINNTFDDKFISLTLNANGGTLDGKESDKYNYIGGRDSGASMSLLPYVPVRDGYTFNGWNTKKDGSGKNYKYVFWRIWDNDEETNKEFDKDTLITEESGYERYKNVTLYASWTKASGEPSTPVMASAKVTAAKTVTVKWNKANKANSYNVQRKIGSKAWATIKSGLKTTSYVDKTAKTGGTYSYRVVAKNTAGSATSDAKTVKVMAYTKKPVVKTAKAESKKKTLTVALKSKITNASGYQIKVGTNKKVTKGTKTVKVKGTKTTIKKLKSKKVYYVKVRAYQKVGSKTYYGAWSKVKKASNKVK